MLALAPNEDVMKKKPRPSLTSINRKLAKAAEMLNAAAGDLRDVGLSPRENIRKIASALVEVFEVQHQIYRREPTLAPAYMKKALGIARPRGTTKDERVQPHSGRSRKRSG
jgi:hypothetical protein